MGVFREVWEIVKKVPQGKVTTYGAIGKKLGISSRTVGWALHANKSPQVPCHRVVNKEGRLAPGYVFGGIKIQKKRLISEGVGFKDAKTVDLNAFVLVFG